MVMVDLDRSGDFEDFYNKTFPNALPILKQLSEIPHLKKNK
jgi:hypothetical protein